MNGTWTFRQELRPFGIECSILEPGTFRTNLIDFDAMKERVEDVWLKLNDESRAEYGEDFKNNCKSAFISAKVF